MSRNVPPRKVNQKGTLVSPGAHWFPQAHTIVRITRTTTLYSSYNIKHDILRLRLVLLVEGVTHQGD